MTVTELAESLSEYSENGFAKYKVVLHCQQKDEIAGIVVDNEKKSLVIVGESELPY